MIFRLLNRSVNWRVSCTQVSRNSILVSLNIPQVSIKTPRLACLRLALNNTNGFPYFRNFVSFGLFRRVRSFRSFSFRWFRFVVSGEVPASVYFLRVTKHFQFGERKKWPSKQIGYDFIRY